MNVKRVCQIWQKWNIKEFKAEDALFQMADEIAPQIQRYEKIREANKYRTKCICGHGKRSHCMEDVNGNTCTECHLKKEICKKFKERKPRKHKPSQKQTKAKGGK